MAKRITLLALSICYSLIVFASSFKSLTSLDGLSQNDVNCIFQDSKGFIWIGTHDGLNRYDGYGFKIYQMEPGGQKGLLSNIVFTIAEDADGFLWLGSSDNGICKFDTNSNTFTSFSNTTENPNVLSSNRIIQLVADSYNNIWVITANGVDVINTKTNAIESLDLSGLEIENPTTILSNYCRCIYEDSEKNVWLGTAIGLVLMNPDTRTVQEVYPSKLKPNLVNNIQEWGNDLILNNGASVSVFNKKSKEYHKAAKIKRASRSLIDDEGNLWVGGADGVAVLGVDSSSPLTYKMDKVYNAASGPDGITANYISALFKDKSGLIWIGTNGGGVNLFNPQKKAFKHYDINKKKQSSYNKVRSVFEDQNKNLWIGTLGGGLNFLSSKNEKSEIGRGALREATTKISSDIIYAFDEDTINGLIWMGASFPSTIKVVKSETLENIDIKKLNLPKTKAVFSLLVDSKNVVWLGTYGDGLWRLKRQKDGTYSSQQFINEDESYALSSDIIRSIIEDKQGNIWLGTGNGLNKISFKERYADHPRFFVYKNMLNNSESLSHNYILPLFESSTGDLWIGTMGGGLNKYIVSDDGVEYFEAVTTKDGLPNNVIKGILEDNEQNLWISTNKGLSCYNPKTKSIRNYDVSDGLQDDEFSELAFFKSDNGEMFFGGVNGINSFYPNKIVEDKTVGNVAFTQLYILNRAVEVGDTLNGRVLLERNINNTDKIKLKYEENSFTIYFSGLHFVAPHKNKFEYKLEGFDDEWVSTNSEARFAKYTNLKPGRYTLKVKASNSDGIWNEEERTVDITIIAPWWLSEIAMVAYLIMIVLMLWFFRRFSLIGVQQKSQLLMERFEKEKVEELSQMKLKFFTNISHEFRTPLTLILGPIEKLIREKGTLSDGKVDKIHNTIYRNTNVLLRLINQLMDFRKYEQGKMTMEVCESDLVAFTSELCEIFEVFAEEKEIKFEVISSSKKIMLWFDPDKLEKVIYNLLSNAFKFTERNGTIAVNISENVNKVSIQVKDSGIGIDKSTIKHVFERFFNAGKTESKKLGSTGIGLSYTKSLVEMHHGDITVESEEGVGSCFTVVFNKGNKQFKKSELVGVYDYQIQTDLLPTSSEVNKIALDESEGNTDSETSNISTLQLLVVEDNIELRQYITERLSEYYQVIEAKNGEEGLEMCIEHNPNLIISDVMMPKMDGFEMCKAIKENVAVSHIPVVLLTAKSSGENRIKGYELGADAYVSKPFEFNVLKAQIDSLIKNRKELIAKFNSKLDISPTEITTTATDEKFIAKIVAIIEENIDNSEFTVEELASRYGISKVILNRKLKALAGKTAKIFIRNIRLKRAAQLLTLGRYTVAEVTYEVGFSDLKYFRTCFKNEFRVSPSDYKRQHSGSQEEEEEEAE